MLGNENILIAGPCAVENYEIMLQTAEYLTSKGITAIRANLFKPRTSPHNFQGIGLEGLDVLARIKQSHKIKLVSEIVDVRHISEMMNYVDVFQVGSRNMSNFELLRELGRTANPILLKRGMSATIEEFAYAAEYISCGGNNNICLCERGIRSFDNETRNMLDLSCIPLMKAKTRLPIIVDLSHSLGRKDIIVEMGKAALACGASGLMVEVHPEPQNALSDAAQQMNFDEFDSFLSNIFQNLNL
ncbi:MAG: bifunctional 3-deoxy-7-phosphoheptulonate synthase/chorismate mutase [Lachnospiraceae bacterium]|nr:bifunctional 3-deoxy-7-phosphoheptulonate synthase/chorismate mutase [Lachnospiraceae bacterium]